MASHLPVFVFVALLAVSTLSEAWNVSIDCGASGSYIDGNSIQWIGDDSLMQNTKSQEVQVEHTYRPLRTLRVFSSGKRNCYSFNATKGEQVLLRATFYYGNYDNMSLPPTFELQFDGNFWTTVETEIDQEVSYEAIYFVKGDVISVCVAQTKSNQLPFLSALEVRSLDADMYSDRANKNIALVKKHRFTFGSPSIVRHPYDKYDRIWRPPRNANFLEIITREENSIAVNTSHDYPPEAALLGAVTALPAAPLIRITFPALPKDEVPVYINMYFAEVYKELGDASQSMKRSFGVLKDDLVLSSEPIVPHYNNVTEVTFSNITASLETSFFLVPTNDSSFPPIINAMEIFVVSDPLTEGTFSKDVEGLAALQRSFSILQEWKGDPCLPVNYGWDWINCSTDISPRVIALNLTGYGLSGPLPDFSSMDALEYIDLQNNSLIGTIPEFLGSLPNLKELNLEGNNLSGLIPRSLFNNNINLRVLGNPDLCESPGSCQSNPGTASHCGRHKNTFQTIFEAFISFFIMSWILH